MKKIKPAGLLSALSAAMFMLLIITSPEICTSGAAKGLLLAGRVIIPSLFPFTACVLFLMKSGALKIFRFAGGFTEKVLGISGEAFSIMLLSFTGGYPVGAKLLNEAVRDGHISPRNAGIMLNYCVNAGPAFVILAVGSGTVGSKKVGYILLAAHILSALILSLLSAFLIKKEDLPAPASSSGAGAAENFVNSVSEAAASVFSICAYVVLFSTVTAYTDSLSQKIPAFGAAAKLLEVTNAVNGERNIIVISFLLGFAGISIWCQVISVGRLIKFGFLLFAASRILHGLLSAGICALLLRLFGIAFAVSSKIRFAPSYSGAVLSLSMLCMVIVLLISLFRKKNTGNILEDIV